MRRREERERWRDKGEKERQWKERKKRLSSLRYAGNTIGERKQV